MISVVIPLYNKAPHIAATLDSVLAQAVRPQEVIVVDDGSTDGGADVVQLYVEKYGVRLIRQPNQGVSAARNRGVAAAEGEYVAFLDADDRWLPNHIETLQRLAQNYRSAALLSTAHIVRRGGCLYRPRSVFPEGWDGEVDNFFVAFSSGLALVNSTTACVKRAAILEVGGFPVGVARGEDIVCWVNLALRYPVAHAEVVTAVYEQAAVNRSVGLKESQAPGSLQHIAKLLSGGDLTDAQRAGLEMLFDRIAFFTAAGFRLQDDVGGMEAIRELAWRSGRRRTALLVGALRFIPVSLLEMARAFRHPKAKVTCVD